MEVLTMNRDGKLEKIEPVKELPIGMRIYAFGAGMCEQYYCITGRMTERGQEICLISNWYPDSYFSTPRHYLEQYSRPLSKKFGIGFYWDDVENHIYPESKVKAAIRRADIIERKIDEREEAQRLADKKEIEELPSKYPHLTPLKKGTDSYMTLRSNILAELKHRFPDTKFSIKKSSDNCLYIRWKDGVTTDSVREVEFLFEDHVTDNTGDFRDYCPSNFNNIFGGISFIFAEREMSDQVEALSVELENELGVDNFEARRLIRSIWWNVDIPKSAENFRLEKTGNGGEVEERFTIMFDIKEIEIVDSNLSSLDIQIIDYSPKSFAVIGDTKPLKDVLRKLGGMFNFRLSCGAGWIFPNSKKEAVISALSL